MLSCTADTSGKLKQSANSGYICRGGSEMKSGSTRCGVWDEGGGNGAGADEAGESGNVS